MQTCGITPTSIVSESLSRHVKPAALTCPDREASACQELPLKLAQLVQVSCNLGQCRLPQGSLGALESTRQRARLLEDLVGARAVQPVALAGPLRNLRHERAARWLGGVCRAVLRAALARFPLRCAESTCLRPSSGRDIESDRCWGFDTAPEQVTSKENVWQVFAKGVEMVCELS